jgi:hypothetical protein
MNKLLCVWLRYAGSIDSIIDEPSTLGDSPLFNQHFRFLIRLCVITCNDNLGKANVQDPMPGYYSASTVLLPLFTLELFNFCFRKNIFLSAFSLLLRWLGYICCRVLSSFSGENLLPGYHEHFPHLSLHIDILPMQRRHLQRSSLR